MPSVIKKLFKKFKRLFIDDIKCTYNKGFKKFA